MNRIAEQLKKKSRGTWLERIVCKAEKLGPTPEHDKMDRKVAGSAAKKVTKELEKKWAEDKK